jgi:hypothetical protein
MLRLSMLGWAGVSILVVALIDGSSCWGQGTTTETTLNPRGCVIDETQKDTCPTMTNVACPSGSCSYIPLIPGCLHNGNYVLTEVTNISGGAQVDAAKPAGPESKNGRIPSSSSRVVCYTKKTCWCERQANLSFRCVPSDDVEEYVIKPWKPSKIACLPAEDPL